MSTDSAKGAEYQSQGQARSEAERVVAGCNHSAELRLEYRRITPFQRCERFNSITQGRRAPLRFALAPGFYISPRLRFRSFVLVVLCYVLSAPVALSGVRTIWAVNDGEKVERDDLNNPNKPANSAWDGHKVKIFGARNEIIAFQLIIEADPDGIRRLGVTLPQLLQKGGKSRITYTAPALHPTNYSGRPIQIFSVNYMNVEVPSHAEWVYKIGSPTAPQDPTGWKPVQLVPENARAGLGGFPLRINGHQNQAASTEVYTERNLPAGLYSGTITIDADGRKQTIPIELELFDFTLPDQNS